MNAGWSVRVVVMAALSLQAVGAETNAAARLRQAEDRMSVGDFASAAAMLVATLPSLSNSVHECHARSRLATCLFETADYGKAISLCDEVSTKWPRGSARFTPLLIKADCLTALGRTNDAIRTYRDHYTLHQPDARATDGDFRRRMDDVWRKTTRAAGRNTTLQAGSP